MQETEGLEALSAPKDYRIRLTAGPDAKKTLSVRDAISIGTSDRCDLVLTDRTVSRRHCTLEPRNRGVALRDEGSKNGCWVGNVRLEDGLVTEGTEVKIGRTIFIIEADTSQKAVEPSRRRDHYGQFVGAARVLQSMYRVLEKAAGTDVTVLLEGESGTGKELLAEAIHEHSGRADSPFVVVDFAAMPESLIESELFGHEKGAFTGADETRMGAFEDASGGTILLDEIGELPAALQTRLLGVLERRSFRRVGGRTPVEVDVRVIAATNRNLEKEVEEGRFRLDLFHRLAVALVRVPPLRERREDIERLAHHFARQLTSSVALDASVIQRMETHEWKGNVRELRNYVERLSVLGENAKLFEAGESAGGDRSLEHLARKAVESQVSYRQARTEVTDRFTQHYVEACLDKHDGDVAKAAAAAQVARRHFNRLRQR